MLATIRLISTLLMMLVSQNLLSEEKIIVKHYQQQARYQFGIQLLDLALSKLDKPYEIQVDELNEANEARGEHQVISGELDLQFLTTTTKREEQMIAIKIPIYRGLLGLRLLLVKKEKIPLFNQLKTLDDLRLFVGGHGRHWGDLSVYAHNKLPVITNVFYEGLFKQLIAGRFDYFHRGLNEIWDEADRYPETLTILDDVMLFYPQPIYFFVSKHNPILAKQLEEGLQIAIADGSFKQLFLTRHQQFIQQGNLEQRTMIVLRNPDLPLNTPPLDTSWWLPKKFESQLISGQAEL